MQIIDTHIHLFTSDHLPHLAWATPSNPLYTAHSIPEYLSEIPPAQRSDLRGFVFVETDRRYAEVPPDEERTAVLAEAWRWPVEEVSFLCKLAGQSPGGGGELVKGIVAWAPMHLGPLAVERFWRLLLGLDPEQGESERVVPLLKGFRYLVQDKPRGTILRREFVESLGWVWRKGFAFDVGVNVRSGGLWQLEEAVEAIEKVVKGSAEAGSGTFVINHLGKPDLHIPPSDLPSHPTFQSWKYLLTRLASAHPSISIKVSGIFSELPHDRALSDLPSVSQKEDAIVAYVQPWANQVFSIFGPQRVLWGSDWPICKLGYMKIFPEAGGEESGGAWEWCRRLTVRLLDGAGLGECEKEMVWAGNAAKAYKLDLGSS